MNPDDQKFRLSPEESHEIARGFDHSSAWIKSWLWSGRWIPIVGLLLLCAVYAGDFVSVHYRMMQPSGVLGSVEIHRYYKILLKNGKSEYDSGDSFEQTCVHALFPHIGYSPCWYVYRNRQQQIDF